MRERYPFLIALRKPLCRRSCVSFNPSPDMADVDIVVILLDIRSEAAA